MFDGKYKINDIEMEPTEGFDNVFCVQEEGETVVRFFEKFQVMKMLVTSSHDQIFNIEVDNFSYPVVLHKVCCDYETGYTTATFYTAGVDSPIMKLAKGGFNG